MAITTITTSQAPDAKPIGISKTLTTEWQTIIEVPSYEVPEESFGGGTNIVPGVAEIISPLIVCNKTNLTRTFSIRIFRNEANTNFFIASQIPVPAYDSLFFPLNGQFIYTGDKLEINSNTDGEIDITLSYTVGQAEQDDVV